MHASPRRRQTTCLLPDLAKIIEMCLGRVPTACLGPLKCNPMWSLEEPLDLCDVDWKIESLREREEGNLCCPSFVLIFT